ncbi:MAG: hypothetical protein JWL77_1998 [Chthonomonadaceae bacterium]|nr:hypothetical protein [Chthonomonadaceae bacterium]
MSDTLSIRKTLILGLGTTGKEVAEAVAEHLTWQFGGFEKAAWVRLLVLETEQPTSLLGDRVLRGGISREEYAAYLNAPRTAGAPFDFFQWQDAQSLKAIDNPSAGAGNLRMLGRLCLFHSSTSSEASTYDRLKRRVIGDISALNQLTKQTVADQLGRPDLNVDIHADTVVYVVGTLCGGTCSGGAADMGYLLREWVGYGIDCQAIFTLPHPQVNGPKAARYKKNAYYALKELNHYQLAGTAWEQKLPGNDKPSHRAEKPYVILRVMMPGGPDGADVQRLNVMIGQYLAAAVGPAGGAIAARDVDAKGNMETADSVGFMRPLFSTMGVAALEYPGEHILRAATMRLMASAVENWCRSSLNPQWINDELRSLGGSDFDAQLQRLTESAHDKIGVAALQKTIQPDANGRPPRVEQVKQLLHDLDARLSAGDSARGDGSDGPPTLLHVMESNQKAFLSRIDTDVQQFVTRTLFEIEGGPGLVAAVLEEQMRRMEEWARQAQDNLQESRQDSQSLRATLDEQITEVERIQNSHMLFGKNDKLKHAWEGLNKSLNAYLQTELRTQATTHIQRREMVGQMLERYRQATALLMRRLKAMQTAFSQTAIGWNAVWREMAQDKPPINGKVYFESEPPTPRGTVTEEYYNLLRQRSWPSEPVVGWDDAQKEQAAQRDVLEALELLAQDLRLPDGQSAFDFKPGRGSAQESIPPDLLQTLETRARSFFEPLRDFVHIADKAVATDVDTVIQLSAPRLGIHGAQISPQLHGARAITPQPQNLAFLDLSRKDPRVAAMVTRIENNIALARDGRITDSHDPFRLLIIRELHGFTFGQMEGVVSSHAYDLAALQSAESASNDFHFWHTRRDVNWIDPLVPPRRVEETEEWWLQVILLGRPADGIFPWTPANNKEIAPEGWYQIAGGEFRAFYPPGIPGVTDTETRLPLEFNAAVMELLSVDNGTLRQGLNIHLSSYRHDHKEARMVSALSEGLKALPNLGVKGLDRAQADRILRRAYSRDTALTDSFFVYETEASKDAAKLFAHLYKMQGQMITDSNDEYPANAYYCPYCNHLLSDSVDALRAAHFVCPACGERYWP